jgi:DNA-binding NarL/FixJ family response regulator
VRPDVIRVVLVDDHAIVRTGLKAVLATAKDIMVVGEGSSGRDALSLAERLDPDVLVMDLSMPDLDGVSATREIVAAAKVRHANNDDADRPVTRRVLILTMHAEEDQLLIALQAGASGYLGKSVAERELVDAVRAVAAGDTYVQPAAARVLARGIAAREKGADDRARFDKLTDREQAVFKLVAEGYTAPEIGEQLNISPKTVDTYKQRVNDKLGMTHRADYVKLALKLGLLTV